MEETNALALPVEYQAAVITADFASMNARLTELISHYDGLTPEIVAKMDYKDMKTCRAELNSWFNELDEARKGIKREYNKPLAAFEAEVKEIQSRITEPRDLLDAGIKKVEADEKQARYEALETVYEEFAPALVPVVPFDRIIEQKWLNRSYGAKKAENELCEKLAELSKDWNTLKETELAVPRDTELRFFETLSLREALAYDKQRAAEIQRLEQLKEDVGDTPAPDPILKDMGLYRFTIEVPKTEFVNSIVEATALKNHLKLLGIPVSMTKSAEPIG